MIVYPNKIGKDSIIGVTATSYGTTSDRHIKRLNNAYKNIEKLGFKYVETANVRTNEKLVSSDGKTRAKQFMELWKDTKINMIAQVYGGEFLMEMIPYIDKDVIRNNTAKWVSRIF